MSKKIQSPAVATLAAVLCLACNRNKKCRLGIRGTATECAKYETTGCTECADCTTTVIIPVDECCPHALEKLEIKHMGDSVKGTGIYHPDNKAVDTKSIKAPAMTAGTNEGGTSMEEENKEILRKLADEVSAFVQKKGKGKPEKGQPRVIRDGKGGKELVYIGLQPKLEMYDGIMLVPVVTEVDGKPTLTSVDAYPAPIPVSVGSYYETLIKKGILTPMTISSTDAGIKQQVIMMQIDQLIEAEWPYIIASDIYRKMDAAGIDTANGVDEETFRSHLPKGSMTDENIAKYSAKKPNPLREWKDTTIIAGNLKKSDCVLVKATKGVFDEIFGCDIRNIDIWKQSLPLCTPPILKLYSSNFKTLRVRVLDPQTTPAGYPQDDGAIFAHNIRASYFKHEDLKDHPDAAHDESMRSVKIDEPKEGARSYNIDRCMQFRLKEDKYKTSWKGNLCMDDTLYLEKCEDYNLDPMAQDAITTKDNIKVGSWNIKHMDIVEINVSDISIPKFKMKKYWTSSNGAQCESSSNPLFTRHIMEDHGALRRAKDIVRPAIEFRQEALWNVVLADKDSTMEDAPTLPAKFAASIYKNGDWFVPAFNADTMDARTETFFTDYVLKVRIFDDGFYAMPSLRLDKMEYDYIKKHGEFIPHVILPRKAEIQNKLKIGDKMVIKRDPFCGPSNMMSAIVVGFHGRDFVQVSNQTWFSMYGDFDGDTIGIEVDTAKRTGMTFKGILRAAPGASSAKVLAEKLPTTPAWVITHRSIAFAVLKSAIDTGSLDLTRRQIIVERRWSGNPMTVEELQAIGEDCQKAIDGMKHADSGVQDGKAHIIKTYGVGGKMGPAKKSHAEYLLERRDVGVSAIKNKPSARMKARVKALKGLSCHPDNPYFNIFMALADVTAPDSKDAIADSVFWHEHMMAEEEVIKNRFKDPTTGWNKANLGWDYNYITALAKQIDMTYRNITSAARKIANEDLRKAEFSRARKEAVTIVVNVCDALFGTSDVSNESVKMFKMTLLVALGVRSYGKGHWTDESGEYGPVTFYYGKAGYAFWTIDEECIIALFEHFNIKMHKANPAYPINPKFADLKAAIAANREKAARRAELKRLRFVALDEETMDI